MDSLLSRLVQNLKALRVRFSSLFIGKEFTLDELVAQITPENLHGEIDPGNAAGNEAW
jgi:antitoxin component of MazEF toxin-antitoxin module